MVPVGGFEPPKRHVMSARQSPISTGLVALPGIEPGVSALRGQRLDQFDYSAIGGQGGDRTLGLLVASQALSLAELLAHYHFKSAHHHSASFHTNGAMMTMAHMSRTPRSSTTPKRRRISSIGFSQSVVTETICSCGAPIIHHMAGRYRHHTAPYWALPACASPQVRDLGHSIRARQTDWKRVVLCPP